MLNLAKLNKLFPNAKPGVLDAFIISWPFFVSHDITTPQRVNHFFAQMAHETAGFFYTHEIASGAAYQGRMGNNNPGDGKRYKGRGIIQLTGKDNYQLYGKKLGIDLVATPEMAEYPEVAVKVAVLYWADKRLNVWADANDIRSITRKINGGYNGLADRQAWFNKIVRNGGILV